MLFDHDGRVVARRPARARADHRRAPGGSSTTRRDLGEHPRGGRPARWPARTSRRPTSTPSASPTSARRRWSGTARTGEPVHNAIVWQDTRTARLCASWRGDGGADRLRDAVGLPLSTYFPAPRCTGCWTTSTAPASGPRRGELAFGTDRHLAAVEPDRRPGRRAARHRRHQRLADAADGPARRSTGTRRSLELMGIPAAMLPEIRSIVRAVRRGRGTALGGRPDRRHPRRPAGGAVRPDLLRAGRGQEHVRHRHVPAGEHRRGDRPDREAADDGRVQAGRRARPVRAGGVDRRDRGADPVAARPAQDHPRRARGRGAGHARSTTTAASTSSPRSPACSRRTGATTHAA